MVGKSVSTSAELSVGDADSCIGGKVGVDVLGGTVGKNVIGGCVALVEGASVVITVGDAPPAGKVKVCTRSPQSSSPSGDSNTFDPRRYPA